ncbi:SRPBCC family protein [Catellatospora sichuanensis]|uniref:SRPBCC family protein n=1 Tax=Catellatospora sichuanensis TaxID=1969805 RepID=UPI001182A63B|nr:SRPBCC family protein [Catellatospora sichuanensis]
MSTVTESVDVHVPVHMAFNQWTQVESFPHFMKGVKSVRQIDATHSHWVVNVAGTVREFDTEITEQHPNERIAWKSTSGKTEHAGVVTFHRLGDSDTRVTVQFDWEPEGLLENIGSAIGADSRQVKADALRFKTFIEERGSETGAWRSEVQTPDKRI